MFFLCFALKVGLVELMSKGRITDQRVYPQAEFTAPLVGLAVIYLFLFLCAEYRVNILDCLCCSMLFCVVQIGFGNFEFVVCAASVLEWFDSAGVAFRAHWLVS